MKIDEQALGGGRQVVEFGDSAAVVLNRPHNGVGILVDVRLDDDVGCGRRAAGEHQTLLPLEVHEREGRGVADLDFPLDQLHLAGCAEAVAAGVRQPDARP